MSRHRSERPGAPPPIVPERVRRIGGDGFAVLPNRFLRDGFFASLSKDELRLYLFLVLAANRQGMSFYHYDRICSVLELEVHEYLELRNALIEKDLIAFDGTRFQVLELPERPRWPRRPALRTRADLENHDPATIRELILASLPRADDDR